MQFIMLYLTVSSSCDIAHVSEVATASRLQ
jgi:hypothetical protein